MQNPSTPVAEGGQGIAASVAMDTSGVSSAVETVATSSGSSIRILSWNVNGIRALVNNGVFARLFRPTPVADIICLQESKVGSVEDVDAKVALVDGYDSYWSCSRKRKGWSGVVTFARKGITRYAEEGFGDPRFNQEGRVIMTDHDSFVLFNVYVPNGQKGDVDNRLGYKLAFLNAFLERIKALRRGEINVLGEPQSPPRPREVIVVGDLNIAHWEEDLWLPSRWAGVTAFLNVERRFFCRWVRTYQLQPRLNPDGTPSQQYLEEKNSPIQYGTTDQRASNPPTYPSYEDRMNDLFSDEAEEREAPLRLMHQQLRDNTPQRGRGAAALEVGSNIGGGGRKPTRSSKASLPNIRAVFDQQQRRASPSQTGPIVKRVKQDLGVAQSEADAQQIGDNSNTVSANDFEEEDYENMGDADLSTDTDTLEGGEGQAELTEAERKAEQDAAKCPPGEKPPSIGDVPMIDVFRALRPMARHAYTCWNVVKNYRPINLGLRIDYILATEGMAERALNFEILTGMYGSDHCPVRAEFSLAQRDVIRRNLRITPDNEALLIGPPILSVPQEEAKAKELWAAEIPPLAKNLEAPKLCAKYSSKFNKKQMSLHGFFMKRNAPGASSSPAPSPVEKASNVGGGGNEGSETINRDSTDISSPTETKAELGMAVGMAADFASEQGVNNSTEKNASSTSALVSNSQRASISPWEPISLVHDVRAEIKDKERQSTTTNKNGGTSLSSNSTTQKKGTLLGFIKK